MQTERNRPGRPKDQAAGEAILKATLFLVREQGYRHVTIGAIAREAGVARQTLYNRWPAKADLVLDAMFEKTGRLAKESSLTSDVACVDHLEQFLLTVFGHLAADGGTLSALIAAAQEDPDFRKALWERFVAPREALVTQILVEAKRRGELPENADAGTLSAMVHGAFWYRLLNGQALDHQLARAIAKSVFLQS